MIFYGPKTAIGLLEILFDAGGFKMARVCERGRRAEQLFFLFALESTK
jgi:hypothetical protein